MRNQVNLAAYQKKTNKTSTNKQCGSKADYLNELVVWYVN